MPYFVIDVIVSGHIQVAKLYCVVILFVWVSCVRACVCVCTCLHIFHMTHIHVTYINAIYHLKVPRDIGQVL